MKLGRRIKHFYWILWHYSVWPLFTHQFIQTRSIIRDIRADLMTGGYGVRTINEYNSTQTVVDNVDETIKWNEVKHRISRLIRNASYLRAPRTQHHFSSIFIAFDSPLRSTTNTFWIWFFFRICRHHADGISEIGGTSIDVVSFASRTVSFGWLKFDPKQFRRSFIVVQCQLWRPVGLSTAFGGQWNFESRCASASSSRNIRICAGAAITWSHAQHVSAGHAGTIGATSDRERQHATRICELQFDRNDDRQGECLAHATSKSEWQSRCICNAWHLQ